MTSLLENRKNLIQSKVKKIANETQRSFDLLSFVKSDPEAFIKQFFDELSKEVDACADNMIQEIRVKRDSMVERLMRREKSCLKSLNPLDAREEETLRQIESKFRDEMKKWGRLSVEKNVDMKMLQETEMELNQLRDQVQKEADHLKLKLLQSKNYGFSPKSIDENLFGELSITDSHDPNARVTTKISLCDDYKQRGDGKILRIETINFGQPILKPKSFNSIPENF